MCRVQLKHATRLFFYCQHNKSIEHQNSEVSNVDSLVTIVCLKVLIERSIRLQTFKLIWMIYHYTISTTENWLTKKPIICQEIEAWNIIYVNQDSTQFVLDSMNYPWHAILCPQLNGELHV